MLATLLLPGLAWAQAGTIATFETVKVFTDGDNPTEVTVEIDCNNAQILDADKDIIEGEENGVDFVATDFLDDGTADCTITEQDVPGYTATYTYGIKGEIAAIGTDGCEFDGIVDGTLYRCMVTNEPTSIEVEITKEWVLEGGIDNFNGVDTYYEITLECTGATIDDPNAGDCFTFDGPAGFGDTCLTWSGQGPADGVFDVDVTATDFGNASCRVDERTFDSAVDSDNGCGSFAVSSTGGDIECTITNTVFFEGIPTMNQFGLAIMALLMLGVGFVGFRRFV